MYEKNIDNWVIRIAWKIPLFLFNKKKKIITKKFVRNSKRNFFSKKFCNDFFKENNFDIIIYLSAITDIDKCQKNKKKAYKVNYVLLKNVVKYSSF